MKVKTLSQFITENEDLNLTPVVQFIHDLFGIDYSRVESTVMKSQLSENPHLNDDMPNIEASPKGLLVLASHKIWSDIKPILSSLGLQNAVDSADYIVQKGAVRPDEDYVMAVSTRLQNLKAITENSLPGNSINEIWTWANLKSRIGLPELVELDKAVVDFPIVPSPGDDEYTQFVETLQGAGVLDEFNTYWTAITGYGVMAATNSK